MKLGKINHVGIVVKDLEEATERYGKLYGIKHWYEMVCDDNKLDLQYLGEKKDCNVTLYFGGRGMTKIELIKTSGEKNIYDKFYDAHGEAVHHIMYMVKNLDKAVADFASNGYKVFQSASFKSNGAKVRYAYVGKDENQLITELVECNLVGKIYKGDIPFETQIGTIQGSYKKVK